ncbi:MAG TPA: nicotinate (nicotinamide) nucleotide adenylyltransferase [Solirubrobacteraceae bacterium]|nr:nicotinate (nicotinamide) nucleotide adenylyltransferase [Solirubrobacteraceae bacterium]
MRIGVLGGSFNPPHRGHLELARSARKALALDEVLLVPLCEPPHKDPSPEDPGSAHRLAMCEALAGEAGAGVRASAIEIERGGRSYTVETLEQLQAQSPQAQLTLILGADMAATLPSWREPQRIAQIAQIAVAPRQEIGPELERSLAALGAGARIAYLPMRPVPISSTEVRALLAEGRDVSALVGAAVASYIAAHHLYAPHGHAAAQRQAGRLQSAEARC